MSWETDAIFADVKDADNFCKRMGWVVYDLHRTLVGYKVSPRPAAPCWKEEDDDRK